MGHIMGYTVMLGTGLIDDYNANLKMGHIKDYSVTQKTGHINDPTGNVKMEHTSEALCRFPPPPPRLQ